MIFFTTNEKRPFSSKQMNYCELIVTRIPLKCIPL